MMDFNTSEILIPRIFNVEESDFDQLALDIFRFQFEHNPTYKEYATLIGKEKKAVTSIYEIPFLPIQLFKSRAIQTGIFEAETIFESSGTTGSVPSRHHVKDIGLYEQSFLKAFRLFYGDLEDYCILGLLPSYLERGHSSLVYMVDKLINESGNKNSGFYLNEFEKLKFTIAHNEQSSIKTILIGVTYALLDFAEQFPMPLQHTIIMETGGMKGRRDEIPKPLLHQKLKEAFGVAAIHSEYGMTELLSQAYSKADGLFICPPWMKMLTRSEDDPLQINKMNANEMSQRGAINIIDLTNIYSCSFIATEDYGLLNKDGSIEILGRLKESDTRGCSQLWT